MKQLGLEDRVEEVQEGLEEIVLTSQTNKMKKRLLIEEISEDKKKQKPKSYDSFGKNLHKAFSDQDKKKKSRKDDNDEDIKIRKEEIFIKEVKTRRFNKKP